MRLPEARTMNFETLTLDRMKIAAQARIGRQVVNDMRFETAHDHMMDGLIMRLTTDVLSHRLADSDVTESFERETEVDVPGPRLLLLLAQASAVAVMGAAAIFTGGVWLAVAAALTALMALVGHEVRRPRTIKATVRGQVTVPVQNRATFPLNQTVYPESLGRVVKVQQIGQPSFYWSDES